VEEVAEKMFGSFSGSGGMIILSKARRRGGVGVQNKGYSVAGIIAEPQGWVLVELFELSSLLPDPRCRRR